MCPKRAYPDYFDCELCCSNMFGLGNVPGHRGFDAKRHEKEMRCMALVRRQKSEASSNGSGPVLETCKFSERYPSLAAFISQCIWDDGSSRVTGTVTFLFDAGQVKAALNDRDSESGCFLSAKTFTSLLTVLEAVCGGAPADWRAKGPSRNTGGKKGGGQRP
jgi:hypothetical protein